MQDGYAGTGKKRMEGMAGMEDGWLRRGCSENILPYDCLMYVSRLRQGYVMYVSSMCYVYVIYMLSMLYLYYYYAITILYLCFIYVLCLF